MSNIQVDEVVTYVPTGEQAVVVGWEPDERVAIRMGDTVLLVDESQLERKVKTINVEPHWPGMLRWLEQVGTDLKGRKPYAVAIMGGDETAMLVISGTLVWEFTGGTLVQRTDLDWNAVQERAFCYRSQMAGKGSVINGEWVKD